MGGVRTPVPTYVLFKILNFLLLLCLVNYRNISFKVPVNLTQLVETSHLYAGFEVRAHDILLIHLKDEILATELSGLKYRHFLQN
jgi:hypothetical protein